MLLKKLELIGFKSFADKTEFVFEPGITALVGPNGCGKSNVVDAVKWILGEQSVKSLRGSEMADIIFNGGEGRKSLGFAEATLALDNSDRKLALEFDEVTITRRVYRSGEGAYFINKQPCRLKDIKNLLLDTGLGMQCYSVIEQGKIDRILVASTVERRKVFDEAAGISAYKARRKEAQHKLERVSQNLLRLDDIIKEVEKQYRSVKYQAAKARRYREYTEELKRLRTSFSLREYDRLSKEGARAETRLRSVEDERSGVIAKGNQTDAARTDCETRVLQFERDQEAAQAALAELRQNALAAEDAVRYSRKSIAEQTELQHRYEEQMESLHTRTAAMRSELEQRNHELDAVVARAHAQQQTLDAKTDEFARTDYEGRILADELEEQKGAVVELMQRAAMVENEIGVVLSERRRLELQRQRQAVRLGEVTAEVHANERCIHQTEEEIDAVGRILEQLARQTQQKQSECRELGRQLAGLRDELTRAMQQESSLQSRLDVLRDLDEKQEGVEQGVREVLTQLTEAGGGTNGLHGLLGEKLRVEARYARAVEAALGHRAQTLVVEELHHAVQGVRIVNASGKGRASFLPLTHCPPQRARLNGHEPPVGVIGRMKDFVSSDAPHRHVVEALLGDVLLVEDMTRAIELKAAKTNGFVLVTLAGEVIEPTGIITGGQGVSGGGIVRRAAERQSLGCRLDEVRTGMDALRGRLHESEQSEARSRTEIERLAGLADREKVTRGEKMTALERLKEKQRMLCEEREVVLSEQADAEREGVELDGREIDLRGKLDDVRREDAELRERIETLTRSHSEVGRRRLVLQDEITELKVTLAGTRQQTDGLRSAIDSLTANLRVREDELEQLGTSIEEARRKQTEAREEIARRQAELEGLRAREQEQQQTVLRLTNAREELRDEMATLERTARELKTKLTELDETLGELRLEAQELKLKMENLVTRVHEEYELDLRAMHQTWQPEEMDWDEVAARIEELRRKIANMGNVNLDAIHDEEALARRAEFLSGQRDDLLAARRQLTEIIHRLNKKSLEMFESSFAVVRENFQEMFRKLFGGGKADLFLEDEQDVLESGIEVIARPPGKEPRALSLLSGGEKVMTAVALLFAIFKAKPSPFCLLDEVDAALDEANIGRFCNILQDFLKHSQFIIITHSKRTMAICNVIYGITMQESGVSKRISVRFEDYEQQVA
ncbi:MAG: hypothetical protein AMS16_03785 [Planctomycetes bacterium DG_58]|nr:MAG: hypothetical protein AMS16_03785 [Planctomycetes bacterium DG_58]